MSLNESKTVSITEDKQLSNLMDMINTVLTDGEATLNNIPEDLESKISSMELQTSGKEDSYFVSPGHHADLYKSSTECLSTSPS